MDFFIITYSFFIFASYMEQKDLLLKDLFARQRAGIKPGLDRTLKLLNFLGNPHNYLKTIHIAGTNGKGTTASLLASFFTEKGDNVGLYTSPHFVDFNERIRVNGAKIPDNYLIDKYNLLLDLINEIDATFFEITTAIAFDYFNQKSCDICIIETGMGGRFDSTNVINPIISIITSISFDHKDFLGDTLEQISYEKAGIIKNNTPVLLGNISESLEIVFENKAKEVNSKIFKLRQLNNFIKYENSEEFSNIYSINSKKFKSNLIGTHNLINLNLVANSLKIINLFNENTFINSVINLSKNTGYFGRLSVVRRNPFLILDSSHNKEALIYLSETIKTTLPKINIIYTGMNDKDNKENLSILKDICDKLILTKSSNPRNEEVETLNSIAKGLNFNNVVSYNNLNLCLENELSQNTLIVGSFFLISDVMKILNIKN